MPRLTLITCLFALAALIGRPTNLLQAQPAAGPSNNPLSTDSPPTKQRSTRTNERTTTKSRPAALKKTRRERDREAWLARLKEHDVEPWPADDSETEHNEALQKSRAMADEVIALFPGSQLIETEHFLVVTNIPPDQMRPYVASLDGMYEWMAKLYGVPRNHKVWLGGKAPIFAFLEHAEFDAFEERFFPEARQSLRTLANVYGLSHLSTDGQVVISCFRGNDPNDFGQMLVHETSHGFIHRYKTKARLPNWVDEGMAEVIGAEMVPDSTAVKTREFRAAQQLAAERSLGGMLTAERIEPWQYGVASSLTRFMLQTSRDNYVKFIEALKEGQKYDEALKTAYNSTPEQLLTAYAHRLNLPNLNP